MKSEQVVRDEIERLRKRNSELIELDKLYWRNEGAHFLYVNEMYEVDAWINALCWVLSAW